MDQQLTTLYFLKQLEEAFRQLILLFKIANIESVDEAIIGSAI